MAALVSAAFIPTDLIFIRDFRIGLVSNTIPIHLSAGNLTADVEPGSFRELCLKTIPVKTGSEKANFCVSRSRPDRFNQ